MLYTSLITGEPLFKDSNRPICLCGYDETDTITKPYYNTNNNTINY